MLGEVSTGYGKTSSFLLQNVGGSTDNIYTSSQVQINSRTYDQKYE